MNFITKIESADVEIYGLADFVPDLKPLAAGGDYDIENEDFTVCWNVELEVRDWGVKDISWFVTDVKGSFEIVRFDDDGADASRERIEFDFAPFKNNTSIGLTLDAYLQLQVSDLEIDYSTNGITVG